MTDQLPPPTRTRRGLGAFPAEVNYGVVDDSWVVHLSVGFPVDRRGWYGTPEQAEAIAADLIDYASKARDASNSRGDAR